MDTIKEENISEPEDNINELEQEIDTELDNLIFKKVSAELDERATDDTEDDAFIEIIDKSSESKTGSKYAPLIDNIFTKISIGQTQKDTTQIATMQKDTVPPPTEKNLISDPINKLLFHTDTNTITDDNKFMNYVIGMIYGSALGDCLGLQTEGKTKHYIDQYCTGINDLPTRTHKGFEPGDWSDDTDHLILIIDVLIENNLKFVIMNGLADKLYHWKKEGFRELNDSCGLGITPLMAKVITNGKFLHNAVTAACESHKELGGNIATNDSMVRSGILSVLPGWQSYVIRNTMVTNADSRCLYVNYSFVYILRELLKGALPSYDNIISFQPTFLNFINHLSEFKRYKRIYDKFNLTEVEATNNTGVSKLSVYHDNITLNSFDDVLLELKLDEDDNHAYVFKTLGVALYVVALIKHDIITDYVVFKNVLLKIALHGGDADGNCAVAGQILGTYLGYTGLPKSWLAKLIHKNFLDKKIIKFIGLLEKHI